jgi:AcrR family transcriptional regulator
MSPKAGRNEEARVRSRAALLQAGADLLVENALQNPFAALRLRVICERARYSTGAFYLHWSTLDNYHKDLAAYLNASDGLDEDMPALDEILAEDDPPSEADPSVIFDAADRHFQLTVNSRLFDAAQLLNIMWGRTRLKTETARGYKLLDHHTGQVYRAFLTKLRREPRPPLDWDRIGTILQSLLEGFALRYKVDSGAVPQSSESDPGFYAIATAAMLAVITRPVGDNANLGVAIQALLDATSPATDSAEDRQHATPTPKQRSVRPSDRVKTDTP